MSIPCNEPIVGLATTLRRYYPHSLVDSQHDLSIDVARSERVSLQVAIRTQDQVANIKISVQSPTGVHSEVRRVGYVPMRRLNTGNRLREIEGAEHAPGLVPDPLFPEDSFTAGPHETNAGWLFYRLRSQGFLHWGYNYWYESQTRHRIDPFTEQAGNAWPGWAYGDPFVVYPGPNGPIDSIRWEVFAESLQDYALLQAACVSADDTLLADIKGFAKFPMRETWILATRKSVLARIDE